MKIENKTKNRLLINLGFDDESEPRESIDLKPNDEIEINIKEREYKLSYNRIVINEV